MLRRAAGSVLCLAGSAVRPCQLISWLHHQGLDMSRPRNSVASFLGPTNAAFAPHLLATPARAPHLQLPGAPRFLGRPPRLLHCAFAASAIPVDHVLARLCREAGAQIELKVLFADMNFEVPVRDTRRIEVVGNGLPV